MSFLRVRGQYVFSNLSIGCNVAIQYCKHDRITCQDAATIDVVIHLISYRSLNNTDSYQIDTVQYKKVLKGSILNVNLLRRQSGPLNKQSPQIICGIFCIC